MRMFHQVEPIGGSFTKSVSAGNMHSLPYRQNFGKKATVVHVSLHY